MKGGKKKAAAKSSIFGRNDLKNTSYTDGAFPPPDVFTALHGHLSESPDL